MVLSYDMICRGGGTDFGLGGQKIFLGDKKNVFSEIFSLQEDFPLNIGWAAAHPGPTPLYIVHIHMYISQVHMKTFLSLQLNPAYLLGFFYYLSRYLLFSLTVLLHVCYDICWVLTCEVAVHFINRSFCDIYYLQLQIKAKIFGEDMTVNKIRQQFLWFFKSVIIRYYLCTYYYIVPKGASLNHVASHGGRGGLPNDHFTL